MANIDNPHGFHPERINGGPAIPLESGTVDTSVTLAIGDALVVDADGYINIAGSTSTGIIGVAAMPITGAAAVRPAVLYWPAAENIIFSGQCSGTPTQGTIGAQFSIEGTTGIMEIDENDTAPGVARIVGLKPGSSLGLNAELLFIWRDSGFTGQA